MQLQGHRLGIEPASLRVVRACFFKLHEKPCYYLLIIYLIQLSRSCVTCKIIYSLLGRVVEEAISANPGLNFNRLFILVCSAWQLKLKPSKAKHFIVCMIYEQRFSNIFVYIFIIGSTKFQRKTFVRTTEVQQCVLITKIVKLICISFFGTVFP